MIRVFKSAIISQQLDGNELGQQANDFKHYKEDVIPADYFGRDVPYDHPNTLPSVRGEDLMHLHLAEGAQHWASRQAQYGRTSDHHLVYCQGFYKADHFLLMAILKPDAHAQARNNSIMSNLAVMAEMGAPGRA